MNKLLIPEEPLQVLPTLAKEIGLNEAIMLQQIHYWLNTNERLNRNYHDGKYWTYNTHDSWQKQFSFWSINTVRRTIASLIKQDLLITGNYNKLSLDRTIWYSVNYPNLSKLGQMHLPKMSNSYTQNEQMDLPKMGTAIPETNQRITTENIKHPSSNEDITHIVEYLNLKANKKYNPTNKKTVTLIKSRMNEGYTIQDFETVIDTKVKDWLNNPEFSKYLRPITLFGTKFENYLNESNTYKQKEEGNNAPIDEMLEEEMKMLEQMNKTII